jgi:hypothetical protein
MILIGIAADPGFLFRVRIFLFHPGTFIFSDKKDEKKILVSGTEKDFVQSTKK